MIIQRVGTHSADRLRVTSPVQTAAKGHAACTAGRGGDVSAIFFMSLSYPSRRLPAQEVRTRAAAPAERTGIEAAPSGSALRRGSRRAFRRGRSHRPGPDTSSPWPETQPGRILVQILGGIQRMWRDGQETEDRNICKRSLV